MKVYYKRVGRKAIEIEIEDKLEILQTLVEGLIEVIELTPGIDMICNEEGKLIGLEENINLDYDIIVGDVIICSHDNEGNFVGLTEEQKKIVDRELEYRSV